MRLTGSKISTQCALTCHTLFCCILFTLSSSFDDNQITSLPSGVFKDLVSLANVYVATSSRFAIFQMSSNHHHVLAELTLHPDRLHSIAYHRYRAICSTLQRTWCQCPSHFDSLYNQFNPCGCRKLHRNALTSIPTGLFAGQTNLNIMCVKKLSILTFAHCHLTSHNFSTFSQISSPQSVDVTASRRVFRADKLGNSVCTLS